MGTTNARWLCDAMRYNFVDGGAGLCVWVGVGSDAVRVRALGWWRKRVGIEGGEGGERGVGLLGGGSPGVGVERLKCNGVILCVGIVIRGGGAPRGVGVGSSGLLVMEDRGASGGLSKTEAREGGVPRGARGGFSKAAERGVVVSERLRGELRDELRGVARGSVHAPPCVAEGCGGGCEGGGRRCARGRAGSFEVALYHCMSWPVNPGFGFEIKRIFLTHSCAFVKSQRNCHIR